MTDSLSFVDDAPLWTAEALRPLLSHHDDKVRAWALRRLTLLYPASLSEVLPGALRDPGRLVLHAALDGYRLSPSEPARAAMRERLHDRGLPRGLRDMLERLVRQDSPGPLDEDDARVAALASDPARLRAMAPAVLRGDAEENLLDVMMALRRRPERWAGALVLEHLEALQQRDVAYESWELLEEMGEVRALEPALRQHRPDEQVLAAHIVFLARLAGQEDTVPAVVAADAAERAEFEQQLQDITLQDDPLRALVGLDRPLRLTLRCRRCHQAGEYDVRNASLDPRVVGATTKEWDGVVLGRIITCKWCGAVDDYELTKTAHLALTSRLLPAVAATRSGGAPGPVSAQVLGLWDGTQVRRPSQALAHLQALAESKPASGEAWRRLGNLHEVYGQPDAAVRAWKEAIARDPDEAEACYSLALIHNARHQPEEAFGYIAELFARQARQQGSWPLRVDMMIEAVRMAVPYARAQGRPLGLRVTPPGAGAEAALTIDLRALRDVNLVGALFVRDQVPTTELTDEVVAGELGPLRGLRTVTSPALSERVVPVRSGEPKVGRNEPCPCGSGKKFKKCCGQ